MLLIKKELKSFIQIFNCSFLQFVKDIQNSFTSENLQLKAMLSMELNISLLEHFIRNLSAIDTYELKQIYHSHDIANEDFISLYDALVCNHN